VDLSRHLRVVTALLILVSYLAAAQTARNFLSGSTDQAAASSPTNISSSTYVGELNRGSASVTQREEGIESAGGTVVVVVAAALSDGLILAADSRLTVQFAAGIQPSYKVASDSANKVFSVGRVGIATYGDAFILGRSIESFVTEYKTKAKSGDDVHETAKGFIEYFGKYYDQEVTTNKTLPALGFIFAGYDKSGIGRIVESSFPGKRTPTDLSQNTHDQQGLVWRGQTDVIVRLIKGYDPALGSAAALQKLSDPDKQELVKDIGQFEYYIPYNYLPLQDGIDLALSLVQTTVDVQRFSFGRMGHPGDIPGVGGTVDVLTITPSETSWVKRKQLTAALK
jgi:20S proteasome alpha/beta subunit